MLGERADVKPESSLAFEKNLCGLGCRVFWPLEDVWYEGVVTRYNKTKKRHRVEYTDGSGDHEWIDLTQEEDRVQVREGGPLPLLLLYCRRRVLPLLSLLRPLLRLLRPPRHSYHYYYRFHC